MKKRPLILGFMLVCALARAETVTVTVKGMVCGFCAQGIQKTFAAQKAVKEVAISLEKKTLVFTTQDKATLDDETIRTLLRDAGYTAVTIERAP